VLALSVVGAAGVLAAGCGGASQSASPVIIASGQVPKSALPTGGQGGGAHSDSSVSTVPLAQQNPTTALFTSIGVFQQCLTGMGQSFIGIPNPSDPGSATDNPAYIKALTTCAAKSKILQALKSAQSAQDNLTPAQVKAENKDYLLWRKCMIARGWGIPEPKPNQKGLLFSFSGGGGGGGATGGFTPPPGQNLLSSPDLQACAAKAEQGKS
jgi:hypothetical protein